MPDKNNMKKIMQYGIPAFILILMVLAAVMLSGVEKTQLVSRSGQSFEKGVVTEIITDNIQEDGTRAGEQTVSIRMLSGEKSGQEITATSSAGYLFGTACTVGRHVIVMQSIAGDSTVASVYSQDRGPALILFAAAYLLVLCLIGGKKGVRGAAGLVFTFASIIYLYIPLVYLGCSPFWVSVGICALTTAATLYFIGGPVRKTLIAALGTISGVVMAGMAASLF